MRFLRSVKEKIIHIPEEIIAKRLIKLFLSRYVMLESGAHNQLIPLILTPKGLQIFFLNLLYLVENNTNEGILSAALYEQFVIREILRIFRVRETSIRLALLVHFPCYVHHIPINKLETIVLDEVIFIF